MKFQESSALEKNNLNIFYLIKTTTEMNKNLIYSTDYGFDKKTIIHSEKDYAPEIGSVFTAKVCEEGGKKDYIINEIPNYTGYIKKNKDEDFKLRDGEYCRFLITAYHTRNYHNFFYAIPLRKLKDSEDTKMNLIDPQTNIKIKRLGEFLCGLGFDRQSKKYFELKGKQKSWKEFNKNFTRG